MLNEKIEEAKLEANPFYFDLEEDDEAKPDTTAQEMEAIYNRLTRMEYSVSDDSTLMVLRFYPAGAQTNIGFFENLYADLERLVERMNPATYHPNMEVTLAGRLLCQQVEVQTIQRDVMNSFGTGAIVSCGVGERLRYVVFSVKIITGVAWIAVRLPVLTTGPFRGGGYLQ